MQSNQISNLAIIVPLVLCWCWCRRMEAHVPTPQLPVITTVVPSSVQLFLLILFQQRCQPNFAKHNIRKKISESTYYSTFILTNQSRNYYEQPLFSSNGIKITVKLCCHLYIPTLTTGRKYSGKPQFLFLFLPRLRMITVIIPSPPSIVAQEARMIQWLPNCPHSAPVMVSGDSNQFPRSVAVQITP